MTRRAGLALPMVLMVSLVVLGVILVGLGFASQNALFVAGLDRRESARYAAEAGAYKVLAELETQQGFTGTLQGTLEKSGATYEATVLSNALATPGGTATVRSKGKAGRFSSTLEVTLTRSGESFEAVAADGLLRTEGNTYANGVRSMRDARPEPAQVQANSSADRSVDATGRFLVRGNVSSAGGIGPGVKADRLRPRNGTAPLSKVDRDRLLAGDFTSGAVPANGVVGANLRVTGDVTVPGSLRLMNGATLHVKEGSLTVRGGISGNGAVVADKELRLRGSSHLEADNPHGVTLYGEEGVEIAHPSAVQNGDRYEVEPDPVADYFARMPDEARYVLSESLPPGAPSGVEFFEWYNQQSANPNADFKAWRDGGGPDAPGLPTDVREWLDASGPVVNDLKAWAQSP